VRPKDDPHRRLFSQGEAFWGENARFWGRRRAEEAMPGGHFVWGSAQFAPQNGGEGATKWWGDP